ncbi:MAG: hypothetical protein ACOCWU_02930 [Spirochaetota bacterium]
MGAEYTLLALAYAGWGLTVGLVVGFAMMLCGAVQHYRELNVVTPIAA